MKVSPKEELSWHKDQLKKLARQRQNEVAQQQKETELVRKNYQKTKNEVQRQGEEDIHVAVENSKVEVNKAMAGKKEKLERFKTENIKHQQMLENQRLDLDKYNDLRTTDMNMQYEQKYNDIFQEGSDKVQALEKDMNNRFANIRENSELEVMHYRADADAKLMESSQDFGSRVKDNQDVQKEALRRNDYLHASKVESQKVGHRNETSKLLFGQKHETEARTLLHNGQLKTLEENQNEKITSKQQAFEQKTQTMEKEHLTVLSLMKDRFGQRLNALRDSFSKNKSMIEEKNSDLFYNVGKISPGVEETPDSYIVSMKVPEHEKENITVSPRNRNIKITYHRNHSARVEEQDGTTNTSKRSELLTKQIPTNEILNPKGVTQKYEDGVLKFKIKKA